MGVMMGRQPIVRDPKNYKYYIPYDMVARTGEPGKEFFPEYISGNLRISNPGTARAIAEAARVVRFLWLEDVWLTGYIAQYLHIQHLVGIRHHCWHLIRRCGIQTPSLTFSEVS